MSLPPSNGKIVLVSGINGYIASHIGLQLLRKGYTVRGASRSASAKDHLLSDAFKGYEERYEHFEVRDITAPGAFNEAIKGVHYVLHTASPVDFSLKTIDEFFGPAVNGNLSILESTKLAGPQLESFVLTSSITAVADRWRQPADHAYTETDWNTSGEAVARKEFSAPVAYGASKTAAERAMWKWQEENKAPFSCSAVLPGVVTGPPISFPENPEQLNETLKPVWKIYSGEAKEVPVGIGAMTYIDVRDVAALHIWCMEHPEQSRDQRYLATNGKGTPQAIADILRKAYPDRDIVVGEPGSNYTAGWWFPKGETSAVASKAYKAMGVERFTMYDRSIIDTVEAFERRWPGIAKNLKS
jgi:nucleoside-diphosphate-sugar epimerase